ncbi:MAG: hypothetical protein AAF958_09145 [Planctomycetota bacterium]
MKTFLIFAFVIIGVPLIGSLLRSLLIASLPYVFIAVLLAIRCGWHLAFLCARLLLLQRPIGVFSPMQFSNESTEPCNSTQNGGVSSLSSDSDGVKLQKAGMELLSLAIPYRQELAAIIGALARVWTVACFCTLSFAVAANLLRWETAFPGIKRLVYVGTLIIILVAFAVLVVRLSRYKIAECLIQTTVPLALLGSWGFLAACTPYQLPAILKKVDRGLLFYDKAIDFERDFQVIDVHFPFFRERLIDSADRCLLDQFDFIDQTESVASLTQEIAVLKDRMTRRPFSILVERNPSLKDKLAAMDQYVAAINRVGRTLKSAVELGDINNVEQLLDSLDELESITPSLPAVSQFSARTRTKLNHLNEIKRSL